MNENMGRIIDEDIVIVYSVLWKEKTFDLVLRKNNTIKKWLWLLSD